MNNSKILITGASGFIGSFIVEEALGRGMEVWAVVRRSSNLQYLRDERIRLIYSDLSDEEQIAAALCGQQFDYVVHAAGATKALSEEAFFRVNTEGTQKLARVIMRTSPTLKRFVFISSLSVFGAVCEEMPHRDICDDDQPLPNTAYARSKRAAEQWLMEQPGLPFVILRPTGVYGPREKDYMLMVDSIRKGIDVAVGYSRQDLTFIYVRDVVQAVFRSMESAISVGKAYMLSDGGVYSSRDFSDLIISELGKRCVLRMTLPLWVLRMVCAASDVLMHCTGKLSTLNNDHYNMLKQRNWRCDITPARQELGYEPQWTLRDGVHEMLTYL